MAPVDSSIASDATVMLLLGVFTTPTHKTRP